MNVLQSNRKAGAFTLVEVLCVIAIIAVLAILVLPVLGQSQARARRIQCVNYLKETGTGFHAYAHDHNGRFPMEVSAREGGSLEFAQTGARSLGNFYFSFRHFQALSNDLVTPKLLNCPADTARSAAPNFAALKNENVSYFVGVAARFDRPDSVLAGDRNLTGDPTKKPTVLRNTTDRPLHWTEELHRFKGNLLFADAHVQEMTDAGWISGRVAVNGDLVLPTAQPKIMTAAAAPGATRVPTNQPAKIPAPNRPASGSGSSPGKGSSSLLLLVEARENPAPAPTPTLAPTPAPTTAATNQVKARTNSVARATPTPPPPDQAPAPTMRDPADAPILPLLAEMAEAVKIPVWLLYIFLLVMVGGLTTLLLRRRPH